MAKNVIHTQAAARSFRVQFWNCLCNVQLCLKFITFKAKQSKAVEKYISCFCGDSTAAVCVNKTAEKHSRNMEEFNSSWFHSLNLDIWLDIKGKNSEYFSGAYLSLYLPYRVLISLLGSYLPGEDCFRNQLCKPETRMGIPK